jgi:hypothetical protein
VKLDLSETGLDASGQRDLVQTRIDRVSERQTWPVDVRRKGEILSRDALQNFDSLKIAEGDETAAWDDTKSNSVLIHVTQSLKPSPSVRPDELALALVEDVSSAASAQVTRTRIVL